MIEVISADEFKTKIFDYGASETWSFQGAQPVIVNFFADWCGPCQMFAPVLQEIAEEFQNTLRVYKVDIDRSPEIPALFGIMSVPTTIFIRAGEEPALAGGAISLEGMKKAVHDLLLA